MSLSMHGTAETADWYTLWEHAVAINGMCVRQGRTGKVTRLGKFVSLGWREWCVVLTRGVGSTRRSLTMEISAVSDPSVDVSTS